MRRLVVAAALLALAALPAGVAAGATLPAPAFPATCPGANPQGNSYGGDRICSGQVPSFDHSTLDVDLTQPAPNTGAQHPLIVMLHGFGNNKHEWESVTDNGDGADKHHWNSHWFARHGYYVLTYTARGFQDPGKDQGADYQPATPGGTSVDLSPPSSSGTLHVKSRDFEIRDTQWLAALVAASYPNVDPGSVAVTGGSYGGGESWLQASQPQWTFPHTVDPSLPVLQLQVAVPKYPWTDLSYALAPNGHGGGPTLSDLYESSQGHPDSDTGQGNPTGDPKASYITGLFASGNAKGVFEEGQTTDPGTEGPVNIPAWNTRLVGVGDPFPAADPIVAQARRGLTEFRSAYYQDEAWAAQARGRKVAIFSIQGWTDDLFEAVESFREFKYLKRLDPRWPVSVAVADIGHSRAQNMPATWRRLNEQAWQTLQANIHGSHDQQTTVYSEPTLCANDGDPGRNDTASERLTATSPEGLSGGALAIGYAKSGALTEASGSGDPDGLATDPIVGGFVDGAFANGGACRTSTDPSPAADASGRYTALSEPLPSALTYVGLGTVTLPYTLVGPAATVDTRIWDVAPGGPTLLMTRGTYRLDVGAGDASTGTLRLPLYGNHWPLAPGHRIRLDLAEVDEPTFRRTNEANTFTFGSPTLTLPTRQAGARTLGGG